MSSVNGSSFFRRLCMIQGSLPVNWNVINKILQNLNKNKTHLLWQWVSNNSLLSFCAYLMNHACSTSPNMQTVCSFTCSIFILIHNGLTWWRHQIATFSSLLALLPPVNSPHKGQWQGALMFSLICAWTNSWANNRSPVILLWITSNHLSFYSFYYTCKMITYLNTKAVWFILHEYWDTIIKDKHPVSD